MATGVVVARVAPVSQTCPHHRVGQGLNDSGIEFGGDILRRALGQPRPIALRPQRRPRPRRLGVDDERIAQLSLAAGDSFRLPVVIRNSLRNADFAQGVVDLLQRVRLAKNGNQRKALEAFAEAGLFIAGREHNR